MERETGFEPATPSLEGSRSSQLSYSRLRHTLRPSIPRSVRPGEGADILCTRMSQGSTPCALKRVVTLVGRGGFEPPKA